MNEMDAETLLIVKLFEEMNSANPFLGRDEGIQGNREAEGEDDGRLVEEGGVDGEDGEKESVQESEKDSSYLMIHEIPLRCRADILLFL
jgi:hypothetical protein